MHEILYVEKEEKENPVFQHQIHGPFWKFRLLGVGMEIWTSL